MGKDLKEIGYEELSEILQGYLDKGETHKALECCEAIALAENVYGYMYMGFIYEEGHGSVEVDYRKALCCYEKANLLGGDMKMDIARVKEIIKSNKICNRKGEKYEKFEMDYDRKADLNELCDTLEATYGKKYTIITDIEN